MALLRDTGLVCIAALTMSCGNANDEVNNAQNRIVSALQNQGIYERGNLPEPAPEPDKLKGYFQIVGGAYRHVVNEDRDASTKGQAVAAGDSIAFMFDARIFTGGNFDGLHTFYTNIEARRDFVAGNNPRFDTSNWPTAPLRIKVGSDPRILKSLQTALISCRAGDGDPKNDAEGGVASDRVRVYLTPNIAFGDRTVYNVPAGSTLVFEVTDIEIIK